MALVHVSLLLLISIAVCSGGVIPRELKQNRIHLPSKYYTNITPDNRTLCPEDENPPANRVYTKERVANLRAVMANESNPLDAYLVPYEDEHGSGGAAYDTRLEYISGYSGSAGYAWITRNNTETLQKQALWTDSRYFIQADQQMDCEWIFMKMGEPGYPSASDWLLAVLPNGARVGADAKLVGIDVWENYVTALATKDIQMVQVDNELIDYIWTENREDRPNEVIYIHEHKYVGEDWQNRVSRIRKEFEGKADILLQTNLYEPAWLYTLRGWDKPTSPMFYSYGMVMQDELRLYLVNFTRLIAPADIQNHLNTNADGTCTGKEGPCVNVREYSTFISDLGTTQVNKRVWVDPSSSYAVYNASGTDVLKDYTPLQLMLSIRNEVEKENYYECQVRDSAAAVEFAASIEDQINKDVHLTELDASAELTDIRKQYENYVMDSFNTIAAVGPHAAITHYRPSNETNLQITKEDVFLVDSGGNYFDGTTDITRTVHYGTPTDTEKEAYTRVLRGMIDLASTVWPAGLHGYDIDARTHSALWQNGWDFSHGSGHGVGYFTGVHEGPASIRMGYNPAHAPLYENMTMSDEPGYYVEDDFGIRSEIIVVIEKAEGRDGYLTFRPATLVPFEPHMILYDQLTVEQRKWLNEYNERCMKEVGDYLSEHRAEKGGPLGIAWLEARTEHIPDDPEWDCDDQDPSGSHRITTQWLTLATGILVFMATLF